MIGIDLSILVLLLLFKEFQTTTNLALFQVINQTLELTNQNSWNLLDYAKYELSFDCRKVYFEHYLNDQHDEPLRRIFIRDVSNTFIIYIYNPAENNEDVFIYNPAESAPEEVYLYNHSEYNGLLDFEVVVPIGLVYNEADLRADIDTFRLPGMKYQIVAE